MNCVLSAEPVPTGTGAIATHELFLLVSHIGWSDGVSTGYPTGSTKIAIFVC